MANDKCPKCGTSLQQYPDHCLHGIMCKKNQLSQANAENARLRAIVDKLPVKQILHACSLIEAADRQAQFCDEVPPTATMLTSKQIQECLSALWDTREAAREGETK